AVKELVELFNEHKVPVVMDADGLKTFAEFKSHVEFPLVLTPHVGEYRILTGHAPKGSLQEVGEDVREEADKLGATILLKGHVDIISDGRRVRYNRTGNPGMTVGGTGDTLSGIVGTLMAQGFDPFTSACAGAFINGAAGDLAVEELGYHIVPTDIIDRIPKVMDNPMEHKRIIERRATR
ncbi:MAG TPA: NAD(P)H-hydrate dehydratase, partial [Candidatus Bathyarchaeota archaeon]|nr:NAD(P)H-hydrate dehydratase [Candidatus Bathyarchaeota archaeon]